MIANSALFFKPSANRPAGRYSKMHLVPFSEYVPFKKSWPWLHRFFRSFVPEVMEQLEPGEGPLTYVLVRPVDAASGTVTSVTRAASAPAPASLISVAR